jgi:zinc protease
MTLYLDGGALPDRDARSVGLSEAFPLATTGTQTRSRTDILTTLERIGGSVYWTVAQEDTRLTMEALKINLDETLDLYADILLNPTFPDAEWRRSKERFVRGYEDASLTPVGKFRRLAPRYVVGPDHPYAARLTPLRIEAIGTADLRRFYERWVRPDSARILIVGDTNLAQILPKLEQQLRGWKLPAEPRPRKADLAPPVRPTGSSISPAPNRASSRSSNPVALARTRISRYSSWSIRSSADISFPA